MGWTFRQALLVVLLHIADSLAGTNLASIQRDTHGAGRSKTGRSKMEVRNWQDFKGTRTQAQIGLRRLFCFWRYS